MDRDGTNVRQLTSNADFDSAPSWSNDGKQILFERAPAGTFTPGIEAQEKDVYVMRADGTDVRRLTDSPGLDEGAEFSPDSTKIVFSSARDGQQELYVMDADGSNPRRLTDNPARDESPDWQALPFDGRGHRACGDESLASGGASSVLAMRVPCHVALRIARRWSAGRRRGLRARKDPRPDVQHDGGAVRPDGRAMRRQGQGAVRPRRRVRVARPGPGAGAHRRGPVPRGSRSRGTARGGPRRRGVGRGPRGLGPASARSAARRGHHGRAARAPQVSSSPCRARPGSRPRLSLVIEVKPVRDLLLGRLAGQRVVGLLARRRRRSRPASVRSGPARCPS